MFKETAYKLKRMQERIDELQQQVSALKYNSVVHYGTPYHECSHYGLAYVNPSIPASTAIHMLCHHLGLELKEVKGIPATVKFEPKTKKPA